MDFIEPKWPAPANIHALTTTITGWSNQGSDTKTNELSSKLHSSFNLPESPIWLNQVHSNIALKLDQQVDSFDADACSSRKIQQVCTILTADCLPLLICNKNGTEIAAIHAGWRGLAAGIIDNTIKQLQTNPQDLLVWLGPAISQQHFEVGQEVLDAFSQHHENHQAFIPQGNKWMADLYQLARFNLARLGIQDIYGGDFCTYSQTDLFYSYRRDQGKTGRMASLIWIDESN